MIYSPGLRKMRGIHESSLGERRVPYGRDHEHHFPDRGRAFHFDWNALKGARDLGRAMRSRCEVYDSASLMVETGHLPS